MADARAKELISLGDHLFTKRLPMLTLWQEIAEHFYVERADFTDDYIIGEDFARHTETSFPMLLRRELGQNISAMLRPRDRQWFRTRLMDEALQDDPENEAYLEYVVNKMKRLMYHNESNIVEATKMADHDFVTFGQAVISVEEERDGEHLLYNAFHLKDCVWLENHKGKIDHIHRKDKLTAREMMKKFGREGTLHRTVEEAAAKKPNQEFNIRHICMPEAEYDYVGKNKARQSKKDGYISIYVDVENCKVLREGRFPVFPYIVPRWHKVSGWQYAYSPASSIGLPDARMIQQMSRIILEAGEKAVDPPIVAVEEAVREVNIAAGAITWADLSFDGKLREAVQPIPIESNMQVAFSMQQDMRDMLQKAWFIDKLQMPQVEGAEQMTAREVSVRQSEFIRNLLPLFEPIEMEYNTQLLDKSYMILRSMGYFPNDEVPEELGGQDIQWQFESPLQEGEDRLKTSQFQEALQLIGLSAQAGLDITPPVDLEVALKDAIRGTSAPAKWFKGDDELDEEQAQKTQMMQQQVALQQLQGAAETVQMGAEAGAAVSQAEMAAQQAQAPVDGPAPSGGGQ